MAGRPRNRIQIVDDFLADCQILADIPRLITLGGNFATQISLLEWFAHRRLICNQVNCTICNEPCTLSQCDALDGYRWRCALHRPNFTQSVRENSFFEGAKVSLDTGISFIYCWCVDFMQKQIQRETLLSKLTTIHWCMFVRDM